MIDAGGPQPEAHMLSVWASRYNSLPSAAAILDEDYFLLVAMSQAAAFYDTLAYYRSLVGDQIHSLSHTQRVILRRLIDLGVWEG